MLGKIESRRRRGWQKMRRLDGSIDSMVMSLSKLQEIVEDGEAWHAAVHVAEKTWTWLRHWTATTATMDWKFVFPQDLQAEILTHPCDHTRRQGPWEVVKSLGWSPRDWDKKRHWRDYIAWSLPHEGKRRRHHLQPRRECSPETELCQVCVGPPRFLQEGINRYFLSVPIYGNIL